MNNTNQQQDLMETINQLSQKMGVAAEKLWTVLVNKTKFESILCIGSGLSLFLLGVILCFVSQRIDKYQKHDHTVLWVPAVLSIIVGILFILFNLTGYFYPEAQTIQDLFRLVK